MNEIIAIENKIYIFRGVQVMLSSDVANLYQVETKALNQTIKRNINRFPEQFCFQLTIEEVNELSSRSQIVTLNKSYNKRGYNMKYMPYALTEQGIMMLSGLLKSEIAVTINIKIIDAFVKMRRYFSNENYSNIIMNHEKRLLNLENTLNMFTLKTNNIFFEGQIYDAYSLLFDILNEANEEIIIIDNYAGKDLLDIIKNINKKIILISKNFDESLIKKYNKQYCNVIFKYNDSFHDRFIIIDRKILYSCGSSFKDLGKKCFAICKFDDNYYLRQILKII